MKSRPVWHLMGRVTRKLDYKMKLVIQKMDGSDIKKVTAHNLMLAKSFQIQMTLHLPPCRSVRQLSVSNYTRLGTEFQTDDSWRRPKAKNWRWENRSRTRRSDEICIYK